MTRSKGEDLEFGWVLLKCSIQLSAAGAPLLEGESPGHTGMSDEGERYVMAGDEYESSTNGIRKKGLSGDGMDGMTMRAGRRENMHIYMKGE